MKKVLKWTGIVFLVLIVAIIALPFLFKGKIITMAKEQANKNLNAKVNFGDMDLSLLSTFPYFSLSVNDVSVVGVGDFEGDTLFAAKKFSMEIDLMSVIKGAQYKIRVISLDQPHILAKVLKNGKANWNITKPSAPSAAQPSQPSKFKMNLKKLEVKNGNIVYDDASLGFYLALVGMNHTLSGDFTQDNFVLHTSTDVKQLTMGYGGVDYLSKVQSNIQADIDVDMPDFKFTFKNNKVTINALSFGVDGYWAMPKSDMDMDLKFTANQSDFKNFLSLVPGAYTKDFASVKTAGKLSFSGYVKGIYNDKSMPAFGLKLNIADAMFQYPSLPKSANNIQVDVNIVNKTGKPDNTVIDVNKFHVEVAGNPVDMKMHVETPVSDPDINGSIAGKLDLSSIKDVMPLQKDQSLSGTITANITMKGKVSAIEKQKYDQFDASGNLTVENMSYKSKDSAYNMDIKDMTFGFSPRYVALTAFDANIGKNDIHASGKIENFLQYYFKKDLLKGEFTVKSSMMDLNQFMSGSSTQTAATAKPADTTSLSVIDVPANVDFVMAANFDKLLYDKLEMDNVTGGITIRNKVVTLTHLKMNMLNGSMDMSGDYNTQDIKKPKVDFSMDIKNFDISQTYKAFVTIQKLAPIGQYAKGAFSTQLSFNTILDKTMHPVMNTLNGLGKLQTKSVEISGFPPMEQLADKLKMDKLKKMSMSDINLSFHFEKGRVTVDPFDFKAGNIKGTVAGSTGFDQTIDYLMNLQIPRSEFGGQANGVLQGLASKAGNVKLGDNVNVKVKFGGTVTKPTIGLDMADMAKDAMADLKKQAEARAKEAADSLKKVAEDKAKAEAQAALDNAKKQAADRAKAVADSIKNAAANNVKNQVKNLFGKHK